MNESAMEVAISAKVLATEALTKIVSHEKECERRWGLVIKILLFGVFQMFVMIGFLLGDKLGWI